MVAPKVVVLTLESCVEPRGHAVDVVLVDLRLDLVAAQVVDLAYLRAGGNRLAEHGVEQSEFAVNRGLDVEVVLAAAYHLHVHAHVLQALLHLLDLHAAVEAVLEFAVAHEVQLVQASCQSSSACR